MKQWLMAQFHNLLARLSQLREEKVRRAREYSAKQVQDSVGKLRMGFWGYVGLTVLLGVTVAGLLLVPAGGLLIFFSLVESLYSQAFLIGGIAFLVLGACYLALPLVLLYVGSQSIFGKLQREADDLARKVRGH